MASKDMNGELIAMTGKVGNLSCGSCTAILLQVIALCYGFVLQQCVPVCVQQQHLTSSADQCTSVFNCVRCSQGDPLPRTSHV